MRTGKWLGVVIGSVVALFVLALLLVWLFVDPNAYKGRIAAAVKLASGRELELIGDIKLSVFPWVAFELGRASLGNPPGFGAEPFVSFQHATIRANLLPLLQHRLEVVRLEIDGLDVRLQTNADGKGNWETPTTNIAPADQPQGISGNPVEQTRALPVFSDVRVTNGRLSYHDIVVDGLSVETGHAISGVIPVVIHLNVTRGIAAQRASVDANLDFSGGPVTGQYRLAALNLLAQVSLAKSLRPVRINFVLPTLDCNTDAQTLSVPSVALNVAGAQLNGNLQATHILDDPSLKGSFTLAPVVLREFFPRWGVTQLKTQDPRALSELSGSTSFSYGRKIARLDELSLVLDDTHLQGTIALQTADTPTFDFSVSADKIDVDRYLPPDEPAAQPTPAKPQLSATPAAKHPFKANGTVALNALHLSRLDLVNVQFTLAANDNVIRLFPLQASLDGGRYSGDITVDASGTVPSLAVDEHLSDVDMGRLLATNGKKIHLSGKGDFSVKAKGSGATTDALLRTLGGHVDARVVNGAVEGVDLGYDLNQAESLIKQGSGATVADTGRTRFDVFKITADIRDGIAHTSDLAISSAVLRVSGQGSTNLSTKSIDFALVAEPILSSGAAIQVPVKVTGTTADPTVRPDIAALAKGQLGQKLKEVLHDKLQGLFGKP